MAISGAAGLGLLAVLVLSLGPARIATQLHGLSSVLPAVLLLTGAKYPLQAAGWRLALPREARPPWLESIAATIAGDAIGYLMWAGPFAGEPMKALLLRGSVPVATGTAAGAAERAVYNLTAAILVWAVLLNLLSEAHPLAVGIGVIVSVLIVVALVRLERSLVSADDGHPRSSFVAATRRLWVTRRAALPVIAMLGVAQHALLVAEAYLMLGALGGATTIATALVFEAVTKIVNTAGMAVPARLGVSEGGSALLADALGFAATQGVSLALMRRVRALIWAGVGLALLPLQEARTRSR